MFLLVSRHLGLSLINPLLFVCLGFHNSASDSSLFICRKHEKLVILLVYIDDISVTGEDSQLINQVIQDLHDLFSLKNHGSISYFLGFEAHRDFIGLYLTQSKYLSNLLLKTHMDATKPSSTPMCLNQKLLLLIVLFLIN